MIQTCNKIDKNHQIQMPWKVPRLSILNRKLLKITVFLNYKITIVCV
jgi:hypothetical protein